MGSFFGLRLSQAAVRSVRNCTVISNTNSAAGGGIVDVESSPLIENCRFFGNSADRGGAIFSWESSPEIEKCVFRGNQTTSSSSWGGGAILCDYYCYPAITNCLFANNVSGSTGGALSFHDCGPTITNCTLADNAASTSGGGVYLNSANPAVENCILWGNSPDTLTLGTGWETPVVSYSDVEGAYAGVGNIDADPLFRLGTYRLGSSSPCIDTASAADAPDDDLDGDSRPVDGDGDGVAAPDMGAYEHS